MAVSFFSVSIDCSDAGKLADFWSKALDRPIDAGATVDYAGIGLDPTSGSPAAPAWMFHRVPEPKREKNRVHADFLAGDLAAEVRRLLELGARHVRDVTEGGYAWATLADPEGNEFDVVAAPQ